MELVDAHRTPRDDDKEATPMHQCQHSSYVLSSSFVRQRLGIAQIGRLVGQCRYQVFARRRRISEAAPVEDNLATAVDASDELNKSINGQTTNNTRLESTDINTGKKGGLYPLPFGGQLSVPPEALPKRGVITCSRVPAEERYRFEPTLRKDERLISEVFAVDTRGRGVKRPLGVQLPHYPVNRDVTDVGVLWRPSASTFWQSTECSPASGDLVNFNAVGDGAFAVVSYPRCESFVLPALGCLYAVRLHRQVSVRCPKGSISTDVQCDIQIIPLRPESLQSLAAQIEIAAATDYFRFTPSADVTFKRPLTVKLPLPLSPTADIENITADDIAVCQTSPAGSTAWTVVEGPLKLSKNSVTFDTKSLTKFCVVLVKPAGPSRSAIPRSTRLAETMQLIEADNESPRGDILPFIDLTAKHWTLWIDCVRLDRVQQTVASRAEMTLVKPSTLQSAVIGRTSDVSMPRVTKHVSWRQDGLVTGKQTKTFSGDMRLNNGCRFRLEVAGDVDVSQEDNDENESSDRRLTYHDALPHCCRRFTLAPKSSDIETSGPKVLTCVLRFYTDDASTDDKPHDAVRCFDFDVPPEVVADYFYVTPPPEPEVLEQTTAHEPLLSDVATVTPVVHQPSAQPARRDPKDIAETINRLTRPTRPPTIVSKEPRVLSGRSLQCLARELPTSGINLAIHLDISESTITGMAFDGLANGMQPTDITYRILLLWKRRTSHYERPSLSSAAGTKLALQVQMLVSAIEATGNARIAEIILQQHRLNRELTHDCFVELVPPDEQHVTVNGHCE